MKTIVQPWLFPKSTPYGPWGVGSIGTTWYVINKYTGIAKRIGLVRNRGTNYFDISIIEAERRNKK